MAGYIFNLSDIDSLKFSIEHGVYSTILSIPKNYYWKTHHEGTFADYITMKEGDNVFFFFKRKIYGIGKLVNINDDCKFLNFPNADLPVNYLYKNLQNKMILNQSSDNIKNRMVCSFKGAPYFFKEGVDMDEVLSSNPERFRMLRAFWKLSFIKIDDEENKALIDVILRNNENNLQNKTNIFVQKNNIHKRIKVLTGEDDYSVNSSKIIDICSNVNGQINHEMALEAGILDYITNNKNNIFGNWDYLTHQVIASPFKPIDYMDKMDIFGYKYIPKFKTISKYLVIEIKKGEAQTTDIDQVMKYVDWVNQEYSFGNYNMIEAYLVAKNFTEDVVNWKNKIAKRDFVKSRRPPISLKWENLKLVSYAYDKVKKQLSFNIIR